MIPLYKPYMPALPKLDAILHSGKLTYGRYCRAFEDALRKYFNTPWLLITNSFNTAISVAITTLDMDFGDQVIASPMGCLASTQPYLTAGLTIKWADVDPETGTLDSKSVRKRISKKTRGILHNHFCGYPGAIDEINAIGKEYGIPVIDDGIECFGTLYKGRKIGNCGTTATVFSLTPVRNPNTVDGGVVIFESQELYEKAILVRDCGIDRSRFRDDMGEINPNCNIDLKGYSATMSEVNGYIGTVQMEHIEEILQKNRANAARWQLRLADNATIKPLRTDVANSPNYWVFGTLAANKQQTMQQLREEGFYASGVHTDNSRYTAFGERPELPGVDAFLQHFVALPCGWWVDGI